MSLKTSKTLRKFQENLQPQMPELQFLKTLTFPRALSSLLMVVSSSSVNMERFKDGNDEMDTPVSVYVRK